MTEGSAAGPDPPPVLQCNVQDADCDIGTLADGGGGGGLPPPKLRKIQKTVKEL